MEIKRLKNKKILLLGFGTEQEALLGFLFKHGLAGDITVSDGRSRSELKDRLKNYKNREIKWIFGPGYDKSLDRYDVIFRVPGYPLFSDAIKKAKKRGSVITSPTKLFLEDPPTGNTIAVTGTKGKGTTSGLITQILKTANMRVFWGGNVGIPIFGFYDQLKPGDHVVLELSSFQLEDIEASPHIAVITNFFPEHLKPADPVNPNYHKSFDAYCSAKLNILKFQGKNDFAVVNKNWRGQCRIEGNARLSLGKARKIYFGKLDLPSRLAGRYNQENIAAAFETAKILGIKEGLIKKGVKAFRGLEHRLELVRELKGVRYYDNSIATTPESVIADINSFPEEKILILGGADKGAEFKGLAEEISRKVKTAVLFPGRGSDRLRQALRAQKFNNIIHADTMKQAVFEASQAARPGGVVLLSPACASFGLFKNYHDRGRQFKEEVGKL